MKGTDELFQMIELVEKRLSRLEEGFEKEVWIREHPPKYKYGSKGRSALFPDTPLKIIGYRLKEKYRRTVHDEPYYWEYTIDIEGIGMAEYPEDQIQL